MKLFRKLLLAWAATVSVFMPLATSPVAHAQYSQSHYYYIYYRGDSYDPWVYYGAYSCPIEAQNALDYISSLGYETYVAQ